MVRITSCTALEAVLSARDLKISLPVYKAKNSQRKDEGKILGFLCGGYTLQSQDKDICEDSFTYIDRIKAKGNGFHMLGVADGVHIEVVLSFRGSPTRRTRTRRSTAISCSKAVSE